MFKESAFDDDNSNLNTAVCITRNSIIFANSFSPAYFRLAVIVLLLTGLFCCPNITIGSNNAKLKSKQIKNDPSMIWAEREAEDVITARQLAETDLLHKIQVSITVSTSAKQEENIVGNSSKLSEDFTRQHQSYSHLFLKGLDYIEIENKNNYRVIAYISRQALAESFDIQKNKIRSFALATEQHTAGGRIGEALRNAYWGYLLALTYPDSIHLSASNSTSTNPPIAMQNLLNQILSDIKVSFIQSYIDGGLLILELEFNYNHRPINDLDFSYYSGMGMEYSPVVSGRAVIPLHDAPASNSYPLTISLEYAYAGDMTAGSEIAELHETFQRSTYNNRKTVIVRLADFDVRSKTDVYSLPIDLSPSPFVVLSRQTSWSDFKDILEQYVRLSELRYGKKSDFENPNGCYIAIIEKQIVKDVLSVNGNSYLSLKTYETLNNPADKYKGCVQVWMKEN